MKIQIETTDRQTATKIDALATALHQISDEQTTRKHFCGNTHFEITFLNN